MSKKLCPLLLVPRGQLLTSCLLHCLYAGLRVLLINGLVDELQVAIVFLYP
jgi:hypothetical protein